MRGQRQENVTSLKRENKIKPRYMYHVALAECEQSIQENGLDNSLCETELWANADDWDDGVYLWDNLLDAEKYQKSFEEKMHIYQVDVSALEVLPDLTGTEKVENAYYTRHVPFKNLKRIDEYITLYHGTCEDRLESIFENGLNNPSLTYDEDTAWEYADATAEIEDSGAEVLAVKVDETKLTVDRAHEMEPVGDGNAFIYEGTIHSHYLRKH